MESVQWSGRSPIALAVIALFIGLLGELSLSRLPLQLTLVAKHQRGSAPYLRLDA